MKPEKPDGKSTPESTTEKSPVEDRVDALTSDEKAGAEEAKAPEPGKASIRMQEKSKAVKDGKPVLTEKQRIEARRKRQATKKRRRPPVNGNAISGGIRATAGEAKRTLLFLGRSLLSALDQLKPLGGIIVAGLAGLLRAIGRGLAGARTLLAAGLRLLGKVVLALDRQITARRGMILVGLTAGVLLIVSQYLDFRAIEIGQPAYVDVQEITRAPRVETQTPIDSHSLLLVAAGGLSILAALGAAFRGLRVTGLLIAGAGAVTLVVALLVDLPAGLDTTDAELAFSGVSAVILSGFWLEAGAGAVLAVSGLALTMLEAPARRKVAGRRHPVVNSPVSGSRA